MVFDLSDQNSIASQFLFELREVSVQRDRERFRRNLERLGQILAYEISRTLSYTEKTVQTPVSSSSMLVPEDSIVLITILRAGLPFFQGFLNVFNQADCGFLGMYREEGQGEPKIKLDYNATPSIEGKTIIIIDPMLATGKSIVRSLELLLKDGKPKAVHVASVIAAPEGIKRIRDFSGVVSHSIKVWVGAVDEGLNDRFFIVPGLGDAGDLGFGGK